MTREELVTQAQLSDCRGNAPVMIDDPSRIYWVTQGEVEIFLVPDEGERLPWLRLAQDGWIFGR